MIVMFSDFGREGPYVGQMQGAILGIAPQVPCLSLMHDAPAYNARASAYLLAAASRSFSDGTVFLAVVDPGVGTSRRPVVLRAGGHTFVGPDNGLLAIAARYADAPEWFEIKWQPPRLSASFHGRDLFAPVAAMLAAGLPVALEPCQPSEGTEWPDDLPEVIYQDGYGNLMTGLRADGLSSDTVLMVRDQAVSAATTFAEVKEGELFWYQNSQGLVEIAANRGSAAGELWAEVGTPISFAC
jgi:hypothetical protein